MAKVAINGFGRIGRQVFKGILQNHLGEYEVVAVNDLSDPNMLAHLLRYDSTYGKFDGEVTVTDDKIIVEYKGHKCELTVLSQRDPSQLPWKDMGVDIVVESTGLFTDGAKAKAHMDAGAKKVIISAPAKGEDLTVVLGVNEEKYEHDKHHIISNASCTTNCLAPVAKVVNDHFGIKSGLMTTIHAYTMDQNLQDNLHPKDPRRARAAAMNMVPTTTGAAKAVALVIPELQGKFHGYAIRVPTPTVSVVDFTVQFNKGTTVEEVNKALTDASQSEKMKGYLGVSTDPVVSTDFTGDTHSSIVDLPLTINMGDDFFKIVAWYDNEWGYATRVGDLISYMLKKM
jgi:glyceraldehyde 3-phosphate dehydrogenase